MSASQLHLKALTASDAIEKLASCAAQIWNDVRLHWTIQTNGGAHNITQTNSSRLSSEDGQLERLIDFAKDRPYFVCASIEIKRTEGHHNDRLIYKMPDTVRALIEVHSNNPDRTFDIIRILEDVFNLIPPSDLLENSLREPERLALKLRESAVSDLHTQLNKLGDLLSNITQKDIETRQKRLDDLDREHQERLQAFETERRKTLEADEAQRTSRASALDEQEAGLKARIGEFETRESKFVRRDLLAKLNELLDEFEEFKLSELTANKRKPVVRAVIIMSIFFALTAVAGSVAYFVTLDLHYLPASIAGFAAFSATMLYYMKWSDRWFREHADEELQSKRYKADMLRASWIAELTAEWAKDGKDAPPEMISVFSKNLFVGAQLKSETEHPADALLGILKRAQRLDVGKDKISLEAAPPSK